MPSKPSSWHDEIIKQYLKLKKLLLFFFLFLFCFQYLLYDIEPIHSPMLSSENKQVLSSLRAITLWVENLTVFPSWASLIHS